MKLSSVGQLTLSAVLALMALGCAPEAGEKSVPDTSIKFEPRLSDRELPWEAFSQTKKELFLPTQTNFVLTASKLMNTFENLMWLGDVLQDPKIRMRGHELTRSFYGNIENTTSAKVNESLYLEAALGEKKPVLLNLLRSKQTAFNTSPAAVTKSIGEIKPLADSVDSAPLNSLAALIQNMLDTLVVRLQQNNGAKDLWKGLKAKVDKDYRGPLKNLGESLAQISPKKSVEDNVRQMRVVKALPLNAKTLADLEKQLSKAEDIAKRLARLDSSDESVKVIMDIWLMLDPQSRKKNFSEVSGALYQLFNIYSDEEIQLMRDNQSWNPAKILVRRGFQLAVKSYGVESIRKSLSAAIQTQVPLAFEQKLKAEIKAMPALIEKELLNEVSKAQTTLDQLLTGTNYREFFVKMSVAWGQREFYEGKEYVVGFERDRYRVQVDESRVININPDPSVSKFATTSSAMGSALSLAGRRLGRVTEFENITFDSPPYYQLVMEVLNKIPALGGFKKIDDRLYPSFHVLKGSKDAFERPLDIKTQAGSDYFYAVPDFIALQPPFLMDRARTTQYGIRMSVYNQAELLRGLSHMIEYFRDWKTNGFDAKMARYKLGDLLPDLPPHLENELLFPKDKLFEYALGISSIILENLKRQGSGLVLFDPEGKFYYGDDFEKAKEAQTLMAGMVDLRLDDREDTIRTSAIARFVLGMAKFVEAVEGFEKSRSKLLQQETDGERKLFNQLSASIRQIKLLMAMFGNFIVHKMQRPDGTVDSLYSVRMGKVISNSRSFEDQVLAIRALIAISDVLKMGSYLGAAYDTYFGLNHVFFDDRQGFYTATDRGWRQPDSHAFSEWMVAMVLLSQKTDHSRGQINRLIDQFKGQLTH